MIMCELAKETTSTPQVYSSYFIKSFCFLAVPKLWWLKRKDFIIFSSPLQRRSIFHLIQGL